jgi:hypothetical protein
MKKLTILLLAFGLFFIACKKDERTLETELRHDTDNVNSPLLDPDLYEAAARFPASTTRDYVGQKLTQVSYHMTTLPLHTTLKIYRGGTSNAPGEVVYEAELTGSITPNTFNIHTLSTPLDITAEDLWISIRFRHNRRIQSIGCDIGPAVENGDWLYQESDNQWIPFNERTPVDINWNIRGILSE